jgi:hypothetical protein
MTSDFCWIGAPIVDACAVRAGVGHLLIGDAARVFVAIETGTTIREVPIPGPVAAGGRR